MPEPIAKRRQDLGDASPARAEAGEETAGETGVEPAGARERLVSQMILPTLGFALLALLYGAPAFLSELAEPHAEIFTHLFIVQDLPGALLVIALVAVGWLGSLASGSAAASEWIAVVTRWRWVVLAGIFLALLAATAGIYRHHPLALDEYAATYQAEVFAEGEVFGTVPSTLATRLLPTWFVNRFWLYSPSTERVASAYWPGQALLLTPFTRLGIPWALNPLLAVGALGLLMYLARRLFEHEHAPAWALMLALASPDFVVNAISFYSMTAHLFLNLLFVCLLLEITRTRVFFAGVVGSLALTLHNPVPHFLVALPWIFSLLRRRDRWRTVPWLGLGYLPLVLVLGAGWLYLRATFQAEWTAAITPPQAVISAAPPVPAEPPETTAAADGGGLFFGLLTKFSSELFRFPDAKMIGNRLMGWSKLVLWSVPCLPFLALLGFREIRGSSSFLRRVGWSVLLTLVGYLFISISQGHGWGFRYFHQVWWALPLLGVAAIEKLYRSRSPTLPFVGIVVLGSLFLNNGLRLTQVEGFIERHLRQLPPVTEDFSGVVFLDPRSGYYLQDLIQNDPFLRDDVLYMMGTSPRVDRELFAQLELRAELVSTDGKSSAWRVSREKMDRLKKRVARGPSAESEGTS